MTERKVFCAVPGCRKYSLESTCVKRWGTPNVDLICRDHWRRLTMSERRVWARLNRIAKRYGGEAVGERTDRIWTALKRRSNLP